MLTTAAAAETSTLQIIRGYVRRFCKSNYQIILAFAIPFLTLLVTYMCMGVYPAGNGSVLSLDLNGQYVYYYDYMYDVFAGKESIAYSWSRNLSGEFMGIVGYYLASPFNLLVWMFPREHITEGLLLMMITKVGAIGACCAVYLSRGKGYDNFTVIVFSPLYALCAYTVEQTMNPMWLDGVMALPIVVYGIEKLIDENKFKMLIIAWVYSFVTCFYIGYMIGIFSAFYFIYYCCATGNKKVFSHLFKKAGLFALSAVTAVMISAFMILPVYNSLSLGKFEFSTPDYSIKQNFNLILLAGKMLPDSYDTVRMTGLPFLYCGTICLLLVPAYFFLNKLPVRERASGAAITAFMFVCMYICPVDMMWHGGQLPNWLPQRYSFMVSFLFVCFAAKAFEHLGEIRGKMLGAFAAAWFILILYLENLDTFDETLGSSGRDWLDGITVILPALLLLLIVTGILCAFRTRMKKSFSAKIPLVVFICAELLFNTTLQCVKQNIDIVYSSRDSYNNVIVPTREVVQEIKANDDGFYRIEKN
ncbi:MAG: YfhO family protein, partial [Ruminiclostridium sp.]